MSSIDKMWIALIVEVILAVFLWLFIDKPMFLIIFIGWFISFLVWLYFGIKAWRSVGL